MKKNTLFYKHANISDYKTILSVIETVNKREEEKIDLRDYNSQHNEETLKAVLGNPKGDERILMAYEGEILVGIIDYRFTNSDYLFFDDRYVYIRYFEVFNEDYRREIYVHLKEIAKSINFNFIVKDLWIKEKTEKEMYEELGLKLYRTRMMKEYA